MKRIKKASVRYIVYSALIAAVYAALTIAVEPLSYGIMQIRVSEALSVLPYFTGAAVPGLFAGCLIANLIGPNGLIDVIVGSIATLLSAAAARRIKNKWLVMLPSVVINAVMVGAELYFVFDKIYSMPYCMLFVGAGQLIACYGIGTPLMLVLNRYKTRLFPEDLA